MMFLRPANKVIVAAGLLAVLVDVMRPYPNPWVLIFSVLAIVLAIIGGLERHEREERRRRGREWVVTNTENGRSARLRELEHPQAPAAHESVAYDVVRRMEAAGVLRGRGYVDTDPEHGKVYPCPWCGSTEPVCPYTASSTRDPACAAGRPARVG